MKYTQQRPQIGLTCFVFDNQTWRRSDFLTTTILWNHQSLSHIIQKDPIHSSLYRSSLLPQSKITKCRCSFGHDFNGNIPDNGYLHIHIPTHNISTHMHYIEFDLEKKLLLFPERTREKQQIFFTSTVYIHPTFLIE